MDTSCHMLIDGRNLLYRAVYANKSSRIIQPSLMVVLKFVSDFLRTHRPTSLGIFWDVDKKEVWRRELYPGYKDHGPSQYREDVKEDMARTQQASIEIFNVLGARQFCRRRMEADDLIYSSCRVLCPQNIMIISSDRDYEQILFRMDHVQLYNPLKKIFVDRPAIDPVIVKSFAGDTSDRITGYHKVGPVKGKQLAESIEARYAFLKEKGIDDFFLYQKLIDLSLNPELQQNDNYVAKVFTKPVTFNKETAKALAIKYKLSGVISEFNNSISHFKYLASEEG